METERTIGQALTKLNSIIQGLNYKSETLRIYGIAIANLTQFLKSSNEFLHTEELLDEYVLAVRSKRYSKQYQESQLRVVFMIRELLARGDFDCKRNNCKHSISILDQNFRHSLEESIRYLDFEINSSRTRIYSQVIRRFCNMLSAEGITTFSEIDSALLNQTICSFAKTNPGSMNQVVTSLRRFLGFLHSKGLCAEYKLDSSVYRIPNRSKLIPCFTRMEVHKLLDCCNRQNEMDCRIRAVIMIAVTTGLRACDIATLKRHDIDWKNSTVTVRQHKTGRRIKQPLLPETGNAIAKYILHFRSDTDASVDEVFLQHCRKTVPIRGETIKSQFYRLCERAGIERKAGRGLHSLRRSAATWLSEINIDPHEIALFLGHSNFASINRYVATNPEMARCSLGFEGIPLQSEVYHECT
jgi:integrase